MTPEFTATGVSVQTYQEIFDELVADYQAIYGTDINVDPDSPDGQRIAIEAQARLDLQSFALSLYNQVDPDHADGEMLNKLIKFAGISRQPGTRSTVSVTITTDRICTLPEDYTVVDTLDQEWITDAETVLVNGANTVTLYAVEYGAVEAGIGTVTEPETIVLGVVSVTNAAIAVAGTEEETDEALRIRRARSVESPSTSTLGGLYAALGNLTGVTDLAIAENDQTTTDATLSLPAHSIWCVVEGGTDADIIETIAKNKTAGTGLKGSETGTYTETVTKPDGTTFDIEHNMKFDRPTDVPLYITLTVTRIDPAVAVDTALIKEKLVAKAWGIGEDAIAPSLYAEVFSAGTNFIPSLLLISDDNVIFVGGRIAADFDAKHSIATGDIAITEVI